MTAQVNQAKLDQAWATAMVDKEVLEDGGGGGYSEAASGGGTEEADRRRRARGHAKTNSVSEKERKIGHRRINEEGQVSYKKIETNQLMGSIQLGIHDSVGGLAKYPERDLLMHDFMTVETVQFPKGGGQTTPGHSFSDFTFRTYAPVAFRYFRDLFGIAADDFMVSICNEPMRELSNPGASGSIFYLTNDDEFILKTVQLKESEFLQKLLPGYYMNLQQNPRTLLPKFFGMYCYQCNQKNIRLTIMNNLLPSKVKMHLKYDLKGSTYKRKASKRERSKNSPTYKDLDFMEMLPEGLLLEPDTYTALVSTMRRDCRVLESFKIMDYSLLVGVHNLDQAARDRAEGLASPPESRTSGQRQKLVAHSTAMESIQATSDPVDIPVDMPPGGIPARNHKGERLLLFVGIIDILQSYRLRKKLEHTFKAMIHDGDTVSVHRPGFYAERFMEFMSTKVFRKIPSSLKHSPSKKSKSIKVKAGGVGGGGGGQTSAQPGATSRPTEGGPGVRPDVVPDGPGDGGGGRNGGAAAPSEQAASLRSGSSGGSWAQPPDSGSSPRTPRRADGWRPGTAADVVSVSDVRLEAKDENGTPSRLSVNNSSGRTATPTWTEGTPSFTESTYSGDIAFPVTPPARSGKNSRDSTAERTAAGPSFYHETEMVSSHGSSSGGVPAAEAAETP